jgi:succinate dehydrogenase flavin-adding protein (antitoxin of CptAB toxin-antitoxin module)
VSTPAAHQRSRLAWRCRRGRKEWDELLLGWIAQYFDMATEAQRQRFAALLELPDAELEGYLMAIGHPLQADLPPLPEAPGAP